MPPGRRRGRPPRRCAAAVAAALAARGSCLPIAGADAPPLPLKYIGCFKDRGGESRDFPGDHQIDEEDMTVAQCMKHCSTADGGKPMRYMALQDGNQCFCGSTYGGNHGTSDKCEKKCRGGPTPGVELDTCGGFFANQVYELTGSAGQLAAASSSSLGNVAEQIRLLQKAEYDIKSLGCFRDKSPGREYSEETQVDSDDMTSAWCKKNCVEAGPYKYFVLQDGNQCFCGNNEPGKYGSSDKCTKDCRGGATPGVDAAAGKCGGVFANQVYELRPRGGLPGAGGDGAAGAAGGGGGGNGGGGGGAACGVPGAVLVSAVIVAFTALGDGCFCSAVLLAGHGQPAGCVFAGCLLARGFTVGLSALMGNILPDSRALSPAAERAAAAGALVALGLLQVVRSFRTAGRDQGDARDEFRWALNELGHKLPRPQADGCLVEDHGGPSALSRAFTTCLLAEWGGVCQLSTVALAFAVDVRSVIAGGLLAQLYTSSLAAACAAGSALTRNAAALRLNFAAGMALFFLAMAHIFEVPEAR